MLKNIKLVSLIMLFFSFSVQAVESERWQAFVEFQKNADATRLMHLKYYGELIEEYKSKLGYYPFEKQADVPVHVHLASTKQAQYIPSETLYQHKEKSFADFIQVLEAGLNRSVESYYDPHNAQGFKPNFYVYIVKKGVYSFSVHQHQKYSFANNMAEHYNKIQISNMPSMIYKAHSPEKLFASKAFNKALNLVVDVDFYTKEGQYLHASN